MSETWEKAQEFETTWWGDCCMTYGEESKQRVYASRMGLVERQIDGRWPVYDLGNKSVLDFGGGPTSILLKCVNFRAGTIIDPIHWPRWVAERYRAHGVACIPVRGEDWEWESEWEAKHKDLLEGMRYDEGWMYNCLQHTEDPERVVRNLRDSAKVLRIFEWVNAEVNEGHPHSISAENLRRWLGSSTMPAYGIVEAVDENGAVGEAFYTSIAPEAL